MMEWTHWIAPGVWGDSYLISEKARNRKDDRRLRSEGRREEGGGRGVHFFPRLWGGGGGGEERRGKEGQRGCWDHTSHFPPCFLNVTPQFPLLICL